MTKKTKKRFDELETKLEETKKALDSAVKRIEVLEFEKESKGEKFLFNIMSDRWELKDGEYTSETYFIHVSRHLQARYVFDRELVTKKVCSLGASDRYRVCGDYIEIYNINHNPSLIGVHKIKAPSFPEVPLDLYIAAKKSNKIKVEVKIK